MINFHKKSGIPAKVKAGEEHVWFTYPTGLYVADLQGNPRRIATGFRTGTEIPVGTPEAPGLLFYNENNKKNYISDKDKWNEIGTAGIPGTGGGSGGLAGNILVEDAGNYYVSVDVEGALSEIAQKFPWYFGSAKLQDYTADVKTLTTSQEKYVTAAATNRPGSQTGWLIQRLASNGKTYGTFTADNGSFFTRVGANYYEMAKKTDLTALGNQLTTDLNKVIDSDIAAAVGKLSLKVGNGLTSSGDLKTGQTISLDKTLYDRLNSLSGSYLKKTGDTATGNIYVNNSSSGTASFGLKKRDGSSGGTFYLNRDTNVLGIYNSGIGDAPLRHNISTGQTVIKSLKSEGMYVQALNGKVYLTSKNRVDIKASGVNTAVDLLSAGGGVRIGNSGTTAYFESFKGSNDKTAVNMSFRGGSGSQMKKVEFVSSFTYAKHSLVAGQTMHVGMDPDTEYGNTNATRRKNSLLVLYPNYINSEANAHRNYARFAYNQARNVVELRSFKKNTSKASYVDKENIVGFEAHKFLNTSTEKAKKDIKEIKYSVLEKVMSVPTFEYKFKNDDTGRVNAGFIIERGVPDIAIEPGGTAIDSYAMIAYLWKGFQEHVEKSNGEIAELRAKIAELEKE